MNLYQKNLKSIEKLYPDLANLLNTCVCPEWLEYTSNNLLLKKRGTVQPFYNKEAHKIIQSISTQDIFHSDKATVLCGLGAGVLLQKILKNMEKGHKVILVEPVLYFIKKAFEAHDFSRHIESGDLMFAINEEQIAQLINIIDNLVVIQDWVMLSENYVFSCEEYKKVVPAVGDILNQHRCNVGTVMGAGGIIAENDIKNLPYVIKSRGINDIKDLFKGKPAISVSTGPSLSKNIHLLKQIKDKVIIIAVAQALRPLLAYDITPDFICTVDYGEVNLEHFKGLFDCGVPLVALNRTYAPILQQWHGAKFITATPVPGYEKTACGILNDKGCLPSGGSVSHMNFEFARHLGCEPIILIGQDLAYGENLESHIEQVDAGGKVEIKENGMIDWKISDPRSLLKKEGVHNMGHLVSVEGYFGGLVSTNIGLASFITSFERMSSGEE